MPTKTLEYQLEEFLFICLLNFLKHFTIKPNDVNKLVNIEMYIKICLLYLHTDFTELSVLFVCFKTMVYMRKLLHSSAGLKFFILF